MTIAGIIIAFIVGILFTWWLAARQSDYTPMFSTRRRNTTIIWSLVGGATLIGIVILIYVGASAIIDQGSADTLTQNAPQPHDQARMIIPTLNVNEKIVTVPIQKGEWDIARLSGSVGWLQATGDNPNNDLAMAFIGHVTVSSVQKGPFAELHNIKPLAEIIYRNGGVDFVYAVQSVTPTKPTEAGKLFQRKKEHLLLVTCTDFDLLTEKYNGRIIVDAVLVQRKIAPTQTSN